MRVCHKKCPQPLSANDVRYREKHSGYSSEWTRGRDLTEPQEAEEISQKSVVTEIETPVDSVTGIHSQLEKVFGGRGRDHSAKRVQQQSVLAQLVQQQHSFASLTENVQRPSVNPVSIYESFHNTKSAQTSRTSLCFSVLLVQSPCSTSTCSVFYIGQDVSQELRSGSQIILPTTVLIPSHYHCHNMSLCSCIDFLAKTRWRKPLPYEWGVNARGDNIWWELNVFLECNVHVW